MSSQGSPSLDLDVRRRHIEPAVACAAIVIGGGCPWMLQLAGPWWTAALSLAGGLTLAFAFWHAGWLGVRHRIGRIVWLADGRWLLATQGGQITEAALRSDSRCAAGFVWLRWQGQVRQAVLLGRGDLPPRELRRLTVRLGIDRLGNRPQSLEGASDPYAQRATPRARLFGRAVVNPAAGHQGTNDTHAASTLPARHR